MSGTVTHGEQHSGLRSDNEKSSMINNSPKRSQEKEESCSPAKRACLPTTRNRKSDKIDSQVRDNDLLDQLVKDIEALSSRRQTLAESNLDLLVKLENLRTQLRANHREIQLVVERAGQRDLLVE